MSWDYIAGFFDGEGSVLNTRKRCRIAIPQTNLEVLVDIKKFVKTGNIFKVKKRKAHWKEAWVYYIAGQKPTLRFLKSIAGRVIVKRGEVSSAIVQLSQRILERKNREKLLKWRIRNSVKLRRRGFTYREIGKRLNLDWSYSRRLCKHYKLESIME